MYGPINLTDGELSATDHLIYRGSTRHHWTTDLSTIPEETVCLLELMQLPFLMVAYSEKTGYAMVKCNTQQDHDSILTIDLFMPGDALYRRLKEFCSGR